MTPTPRARFAPRPCPLCQSLGREVVFTQRFVEFSSGSLLDGYDVAVCAGCGFGFADDIPEQAVFDRYYRDMSKYEYAHRAGLEPDWVMDRYRATAGLIHDHLPEKSQRILDMGCATGGMLAALRERGYANLLGYDPAPRCVEAARRLHDVTVETKSLGDLTHSPAAFDLILLSGVLEHVRDLGSAVAALASAVRPGGAAQIGVPDATEFVRWPNAPFQEFSIEHVNFFSPASLDNLMGLHGFERIVSVKAKSELSRNVVEPIVNAIYRKTGKVVPPRHDATTIAGLREYVAHCSVVNEKVNEKIRAIADAGEPIVVWGVGTHTLRLMATTPLGRAKITAFVDSNQNYAGKQINGIRVEPPAFLNGRNEPILISSWVYQTEIARQLTDKMKLRNRIITLYDR